MGAQPWITNIVSFVYFYLFALQATVDVLVSVSVQNTTFHLGSSRTQGEVLGDQLYFRKTLDFPFTHVERVINFACWFQGF